MNAKQAPGQAVHFTTDARRFEENLSPRADAVRKSRALRPSLESCETRLLMRAGGDIFEPIDFAAVLTGRNGTPSSLNGALQINQSGDGGLRGSLKTSDGATMTAVGNMNNGQISLRIRTGDDQWLRVSGPVVTAKAGDGKTTLHGGGEILGRNSKLRGSFTLIGSDVVLPRGRLGDPAKAPRVIKAGTILAPTDFTGVVRKGQNAGTAIFGTLSLGRVDLEGAFAGSLKTQDGQIPASGRIVGRRIELNFDLGDKGVVGGIGPFSFRKLATGEVKITAYGSLQTGDASDSGDWALASTSMSYRNFDGVSGVVLNLNSVYLTSTRFFGTSFAQATLTNSQIESDVFFSYANFPYGANLSNSLFSSGNFIGAWLVGADFSNSNLSSARLENANLSFANLTGTNLDYARLNNARFDGAIGLAPKHLLIADMQVNGRLYGDLSGKDLSRAYLALLGITDVTAVGANFSGSNFTEANFSRGDFSRANFAGANLSRIRASDTNFSGANLSGAFIGAYPGTSLSNLNFAGANLSGATISGPINGLNFRGANMRGANFSGAFGAGIGAKTTLVHRLQNQGGRGQNLQFADLSGEDLSGIDFTGANFLGANLDGVNLRGANIAGIVANNFKTLITHELQNQGGRGRGLGFDLSQADLAGVDFTGADFSNGQLNSANLTGANFTGANLSYLDLSSANLTGANLTGANLQGANLRGANITGVIGLSYKDWAIHFLQNRGGRGYILDGIDLSGADLNGIDFTGSSLVNANLSFTSLRGANLSGTSLVFANLSNSDFLGVTFSPQTNLHGANLSYGRLAGTNLIQAFMNTTRLDYADVRGTGLTADFCIPRNISIVGTIFV